MMFKYRNILFDSLICIGLMGLAGFIHILYPVEIRWDLANYHYYNPWAFFHDRLGYDIAPGMINTYFNPLIDIPYYLMLNHWGDVSIVKFFQGSYYGILVFIFYKICCLFFNFKEAPIALAAAVIIGATGFASLSQLGICSNEVQVSILILWGFYLICKHIGDEDRQKRVWIWSGLLMGMALGFKPTVISYCLAAGISLILFKKPLRVSFKEIFVFALFGLLGYLLVNGWWMWQLYSHFDSPFFPFLNKIFKSDYYDLINFRDTGFVDKTTWWQKLFLPVIISFLSLKNEYVSELPFWDLRYVLTYLIGLCMFFIWCCRSRRFLENKFLLLYVFIFFSFVIWVYFFSIIRYAIPMEMLFAIVIVKFFQKIKFRGIFTNAVWISFQIIGFYALFGDAPEYLQTWKVALPFMSVEKINLPDNALVKTYGYPISMVAAQLIGEQSNRISSHAHSDGPNIHFLEYSKLSQKRAEIEQNHQGPVVALISYNIEQPEAQSLYFALSRRAMLEKEGMYCRPLQTYVDIVDICVPEDLKDEIFIEEEKSRKFEIGGKDISNLESKEDLNQYIYEVNKVLNYESSRRF